MCVKKKNCTGAHSILMDIIQKQTAIFLPRFQKIILD